MRTTSWTTSLWIARRVVPRTKSVQDKRLVEGGQTHPADSFLIEASLWGGLFFCDDSSSAEFWIAPKPQASPLSIRRSGASGAGAFRTFPTAAEKVLEIAISEPSAWRCIRSSSLQSERRHPNRKQRAMKHPDVRQAMQDHSRGPGHRPSAKAGHAQQRFQLFRVRLSKIK